MRQIVTLLMLCASFGGNALADTITVSPPAPLVVAARQPVSDWTLVTGTSSLEVLPELRARLSGDIQPARPRTVSLRRVTATDPSIGDGSYGVVFNHGMQAYGALTGEVLFRPASPASNGQAEAIGSQCGLAQIRRIGTSDSFRGQVPSAKELRDAVLRLRHRPDVASAEWVVVYGLASKPIDEEMAKIR